MVLLVDPLQQRFLEGGQFQEEVLRIAKLGRVSADAAVRLHQFDGVQGVAARVALVAPGSLVGAMGTRALDVPVGQEAVAARAVRQQHGVRVDVPLFLQPQEKVLHDLLVVRGVGGGEQVERDAQPLPGVEELGMVALQHFLRFHAFLVGADGDGRAMGVGAGDHQHVVALHAVISGENIGGQVAAGHMTHVQRAVGVGPRDTYQDALRHGYPP